MLLLDYLRRIKESEVRIPPFHTGHLGLLPDTEVSVRLMGNLQERESDCELYLTPFAEDVERLCSLHCVLRDQPGVVNRIITAIYSLRINIVTLGSSVTDYKTTHTVDMLLDWNRSYYPERLEAPERIKRIYKDINCRIPTHDLRYVLLYEAIISLCGNEIQFDQAYGRFLPSISLMPFAPRQTVDATPLEIKRGHKKTESELAPEEKADKQSFSQQNYFKLHEGHELQIRHATGHSEEELLPCILNSSPSERSLRVYFPAKDTVKKFVHVGFRHTNRPGAVWAITRVLELAGFNIITGLLRKKDSVNSSFEAVLEYSDAKGIPANAGDKGAIRDYDKILRWCFDEICKVGEKSLCLLHPFNVRLGVPEYGTHKSTSSLRIPSASIDCTKRVSNEDLPSSKDLVENLKNSVKELEQSGHKFPLDEANKVRLRYLQKTHTRLEQKRPRVFLSYPSYAAEHATAIKQALDYKAVQKQIDAKTLPADSNEGSVEIREYQEPDFENIVQSVMRRIRECDYFIGIWHHEGLGPINLGDGEPGKERYSVSPWMPFEYGIAMEAGKDCRIIYSKRLPEKIWKRIDPSTGKDSYSDFTFKDQTVKRLANWVRLNWAAKWTWLEPFSRRPNK